MAQCEVGICDYYSIHITFNNSNTLLVNNIPNFLASSVLLGYKCLTNTTNPPKILAYNNIHFNTLGSISASSTNPNDTNTYEIRWYNPHAKGYNPC